MQERVGGHFGRLDEISIVLITVAVESAAVVATSLRWNVKASVRVFDNAA